MPKRIIFALTCLALIGWFVAYKLGSLPPAFASGRPSSQDNSNLAVSALPTAPATWVLAAAAGGSTGASVTRPAGGSGVKHVAQVLSAIQTTQSTVGCFTNLYLRNGASGTGTILMRWVLPAPAAPGNASYTSSQLLHLPDVNVVGSPNTPMTFEFAGNCGIGSSQSVDLVGYDAQ